MLWQSHYELAERTLNGVNVAGSIAGVNRTKNAVRVMCSRVELMPAYFCQRANRLEHKDKNKFAMW